MILIFRRSYSIKIFCLASGRSPYSDWSRTLDKEIRARLSARISRFQNGQFGNYSAVGEGVFEARFFGDSGYRVYFAFDGEEIILLLGGGNREVPADDIQGAKFFLKVYREDQNANKDQ